MSDSGLEPAAVPDDVIKALEINDGFEEATMQDDGNIMADFRATRFHNPVCGSAVLKRMRDAGWTCDGAALQQDGDLLRTWFIPDNRVAVVDVVDRIDQLRDKYCSAMKSLEWRDKPCSKINEDEGVPCDLCIVLNKLREELEEVSSAE